LLTGGSSDAKNIYKIKNLTDEEATLVEPTSCAIHGMDQLNTPAGAEVLVIGAGPTGLVLAQLLKLNGAIKVVIAANKGIKTQKARELNAGDDYVELDREHPGPQWEQIKKDYPYGFDVVVRVVFRTAGPPPEITYFRLKLQVPKRLSMIVSTT
jgi:D-arabinitol dehydrogenase (NADP+)